MLLSILLLRSQGHRSSRARGVAPEELGSKVGIARQELGRGWGEKSKIDSQLWSMYGVFHDECIYKWHDAAASGLTASEHTDAAFVLYSCLSWIAA